MKRILLTAVSLGALGVISPALAADLPYAKAPELAPPVYDWTGVYVGVFGGGGFGNHNVNNANGAFNPFANFTANYSSTGGIAGGEVGYNWQSGNYIIGVEGDLFWSGIKGNDASQFFAGNFPGVIILIFHEDRSVMGLHQAPNNREPKSGAAWSGPRHAVELFKKMRNRSLRNPWTFVAHNDSHSRVTQF